MTHDTAAFMVAKDKRQTDALKALDRWVETLKGSTDPNVKRVAMAMDGIIEEAI